MKQSTEVASGETGPAQLNFITLGRVCQIWRRKTSILIPVSLALVIALLLVGLRRSLIAVAVMVCRLLLIIELSVSAARVAARGGIAPNARAPVGGMDLAVICADLPR